MHFDRYSDISRIIYANLQQVPAVYPQITSGTSSRTSVRPEDEEVIVKKEENGRKSDQSDYPPHRHHHQSPATTASAVQDQARELDEESGTVNCNQVVEEKKKKKDKEQEVVREKNLIRTEVVVEQDQDFEKILAAASAEWDKKEAEMKDLDRLVNELLQEASQIPDIPYHAREDGLPFSYCPQGDIADKRSKLGGRSGAEYGTTHSSVSSTPKQNWSPIRSPSTPSITPTISTSQNTEYLPKNWNQSTQQQHTPTLSSSTPKNWERRERSPENYSKEAVDGSKWSKVTVEHEPKGLVWTSIPPAKRQQQQDNSSSRVNHHNHHETQIPIRRVSSPERTGGIPIPIARQQSRDWDVFEEVRKKEQELEDWIRTASASSTASAVTAEPRKQVKYSRSFSADNFNEQGSDEWLSKQMAKLQLKRSSSIRHTGAMVRQDGGTPAWLIELKQRNLNRNAASSVAEEKQQQQERVIQVSATTTSSSNETVDSSAAPTPRFPPCPPTPYMNKSAASRRIESNVQRTGGRSTVHTFAPRSNPVTDDDTEDEEEIAKIMFSRKQEEDLRFTVDTSCNWYKPNANREETISALTHRPPGTFIIRNSNSFPGAYGLAVKVDDTNVRHFLIEPTRAGVRLRGSAIEPVFGSLSALVYAHTIQPLALPVKLRLHTEDNLLPTSLSQSTTSKLLSQGAACQLLFLGANNVEMLTGTEAIQRSVTQCMTNRPTLVNLRLSKSGLVLTDVLRESFFRNHHPLSSILHAGLDPLNRSISVHGKVCKLFGIVVASQKHNLALVLSEYEEGQPAVAIVSFILRVIQWRNL